MQRSCAQTVTASDSLALVDLYNSTNGVGWHNNTNWLNGPVSTWFGITITNKRVTEIILEVDNLTGTLPSTISNLTALTKLDLAYNAIAGAVPESIGTMTKLTYLSLTYNRFSGPIPAVIGNLTNLQYLGLNYIHWGGSIPLFIGRLKNLTELYLGDNEFTGSIPDTLAGLTKLSTLDLEFNKLTGTIPTSFTKLKALVFFTVYVNRLSGELPFTTLKAMTALRTVDLGNNRFTLSNNIAFPAFTTKANISSNRLTFNGIESLANEATHPQVYYQPQAPVSIHKHGNTLAVYAGGTLSNNTYKWYKVGTASPVIITGDSLFLPSQSGLYYANITNAKAVRLTLKTDTVNYVATSINIKTGDAVMSENPVSDFKIFPNPAKNVVYITTKSAAKIIIINSSGKQVLSTIVSGKKAIDITRLPGGIYYVKSGSEKLEKLVVLK